VTSTPLIVQALRQPAVMSSFTLADWDVLIRQAREADLLAHICASIQRHGLLTHIPPQAREHLEWSRVIAERHIEAVQWEVELIRKALAEIGVPVVLLKGAAYVIGQLPPAQGRIFSDVDIIVPKEKLDMVEANLMLHGWAATHHDAYDQRYYRTWMHELPPMRHIKRMTVIDVHHAILPATAHVHPDSEKLLATAIPVEGHDKVMVFAPVDMVLHSATHLFHNEQLDHGLRDLVDLDCLLRHFSDLPAFWPTLVMRAQELELTRSLFYALRYTTQILNTPIPPSVIQAAQIGSPNQLLAALMDLLFTRALLPNHPSCSNWFATLARRVLYVRATWLRMPPFMLARHLFHKAFISPKSDE
jgi:hypothetical protein